MSVQAPISLKFKDELDPIVAQELERVNSALSQRFSQVGAVTFYGAIDLRTRTLNGAAWTLATSQYRTTLMIAKLGGIAYVSFFFNSSTVGAGGSGGTMYFVLPSDAPTVAAGQYIAHAIYSAGSTNQVAWIEVDTRGTTTTTGTAGTSGEITLRLMGVGDGTATGAGTVSNVTGQFFYQVGA